MFGIKWNPLKDIQKGVEGLAKNVERNVSSTFNELGYAISTGNFNNLDQTLARLAVAGATGGYSLGANPDELKYKETNIERAGRDAENKAASDQAAMTQQEEAARLKTLADILSSSSARRRLMPGSSVLGGLLG